jgi:hypothetical protein
VCQTLCRRSVPQAFQKSLKRSQFFARKTYGDAVQYLRALHTKAIDVLENYNHALNCFENPNDSVDGDSLTYITHLRYKGIALPKDFSKQQNTFLPIVQKAVTNRGE